MTASSVEWHRKRRRRRKKRVFLLFPRKKNGQLKDGTISICGHVEEAVTSFTHTQKKHSCNNARTLLVPIEISIYRKIMISSSLHIRYNCTSPPSLEAKDFLYIYKYGGFWFPAADIGVLLCLRLQPKKHTEFYNFSLKKDPSECFFSSIEMRFLLRPSRSSSFVNTFNIKTYRKAESWEKSGKVVTREIFSYFNFFLPTNNEKNSRWSVGKGTQEGYIVVDVTIRWVSWGCGRPNFLPCPCQQIDS